MNVTENQEAIERNERVTADIGRLTKATNIALLVIGVCLAVALAAVSVGFSTSNSTLAAINEANVEELRCRSEATNRQADAQAKLSIQQAESEALTSDGLILLEAGESLAAITAALAENGELLRALSLILDDATEARNESVEACQQED